MKTYWLLGASLLLGVAVASVVHSQNPPAQAGGAPPAVAPLPGAPTAAGGPIDRQQVSYALGRQFAMNLRQNDISCDLNSLVAGISDVLNNAQPKWTDEQLGQTMQRFMQEMHRKAMARLEQEAAKNRRAEADFLAKNKSQPGVQTTASGLQYKVIKQGNGPSPTLSDTVRCNYRGVLLDGTEFDSTERHGGPAEFGVSDVIAGWTEALQKMKVGDKWQLFVPSALAYDLQPPPESGIEPGSMLVFEIELLGIDGN